MRLYLGTSVGFDASVTGAIKGAWAASFGGSSTPCPAYLSKAGAPNGNAAIYQFGGGVDEGNIFTHQVYALTSAADVFGEIQICLPAYASYAPEQDAHFRCHAWVGVGKTSTVRGTLLANYTEAAGATNRLETTLLARSFIAPQALTRVAAEAGDYLHIEIGFVYHVAPGDAACYYQVGPKDAGGTELPDYTTDQLAYSGGAWQGASWVEILATGSSHNLLTGSTHTVQGSDNLIAGVDGTVTGDQNALFALCAGSPAPSITGDHTFKVCADVIDLTAPTVTVNGAPLVSALDDLSDVTLGSPVADGDVLTYDTGAGAWTNVAPPTGTLDGLSDVAIGSPLTDGDVLTYDTGTSAWTNVAPTAGSGTLDGLSDVGLGSPVVDGDVLTYVSGAWTNAAPTAGGLVLLEQHTASSSATLDFTTFYSSAFDDYQVEIVDLVAATNNVDFEWNYSSDGGSTWNTTANYYACQFQIANDGSTGAVFLNPGAYWLLARAVTNTSSRSLNATLHIRALGSTALDKPIYGQVAYTNQSYVVTGSLTGLFTVPSTAFNAVRFAMSSGNIASGTIRIYGLAK